MNTTRSLIRSSWNAIERMLPAPKGGDHSELPTVAIMNEPPLPKVFDDEPDMILEGRGWRARGKLTANGFIVYAGSTVKNISPCFIADKVYFPIRRDLMVDGIIDENGAFTRNHAFKSAVQAARVIASAYISVKKWHTLPDEDGVTMTYEECHPSTRGIKKRAQADRQRRKDAENARRERREAVIRRADAVIDGRAWRHEWRGQCPIRDNGIYLGA